MTLRISDGRISGSDALRSLVEAVRDANAAEPETTAIEWKCTLDLADAGAKFKIAKNLLAFANRDPGAAAREFDGHAYLLIGTEPGSVSGVAPPDPAALDDALRRYVRPDAPHWELRLVEVDQKTVAVIEVAPPRPGDRIATLQTAYEKWPAGRIFVRRPGKSVEAGPAEIEMLERRLLALTDEDRAAQAQRDEIDRQHLALAQQNAHLDAKDRAKADVADFRPLASGEGFALDAETPRFSGVMINAGGPTIVTGAMLHTSGGAFPGGVSVRHPTGERQSESGRVAVESGEILQVRVGHDGLAALTRSLETLTLAISFIDADGWSGTQKVALGRSGGADARGRLKWTARPEHSLHSALTPPPAT